MCVDVLHFFEIICIHFGAKQRCAEFFFLSYLHSLQKCKINSAFLQKLKTCKFLFAEMLLLFRKQSAVIESQVQDEILGDVTQEDWSIYDDQNTCSSKEVATR